MVSAPDKGDLVWLEFTPQAGKEQAGRRPALVLTPRAYNEKVGLMIACPITSKIKNYPFEVVLPPESEITGVILADHMRSVDWRARNATIAGRSSNATLSEVQEKVKALLFG